MTDFVHRGACTRKVNRWMCQPGPIVYRTKLDVFESILTIASVMVLGCAGIVIGLLILQGL